MLGISERTAAILASSLPSIVVPGLLVTLPLALVSFSLGLVLASVVALVRHARVPLASQLARIYVWVFRGTPLLVQLYVAFYGLPDLGLMLEPIPAAILVFSLNTGAYASETLRGALSAVPQGQMEAALSQGFTYLGAMRYIVGPQALRAAFPPLFNELISLVKDTSLAANITVLEMLMATQRIVSRTYETLPLYLEVAAIYLLFSSALVWLQGLGEKRLARTARSCTAQAA